MKSDHLSILVGASVCAALAMSSRAICLIDDGAAADKAAAESGSGEIAFAEMIRDPAEYGEPLTAKVHPDEIENYKVGGWRLPSEAHWNVEKPPLAADASSLNAQGGDTGADGNMTVAKLHEAIKELGGSMPVNSTKALLVAELAKLTAERAAKESADADAAASLGAAGDLVDAEGGGADAEAAAQAAAASAAAAAGAQ